MRSPARSHSSVSATRAAAIASIPAAMFLIAAASSTATAASEATNRAASNLAREPLHLLAQLAELAYVHLPREPTEGFDRGSGMTSIARGCDSYVRHTYPAGVS